MGTPITGFTVPSNLVNSAITDLYGYDPQVLLTYPLITVQHVPSTISCLPIPFEGHNFTVSVADTSNIFISHYPFTNPSNGLQLTSAIIDGVSTPVTPYLDVYYANLIVTFPHFSQSIIYYPVFSFIISNPSFSSSGYYYDYDD